MGFLSGVITGVAVSALGAAWYMSRSGERFRDQYRVEQRLGEIGDQLEARTREIQTQVNSQIAEMRAKSKDATDLATNGNGHDAAAKLDEASAAAAEAAAEVGAAVEAAADETTRS